MSTRKLLTFLSLAAWPLVLSGCGNFLNTNSDYIPLESYRAAATTTGDEEDANSDYTCPSQPNVKPYYDDSINNAGHYTVCTSKTSTSKILIHGKTTVSNTICVFPAKYYDMYHVPAEIGPDRYPFYLKGAVSDVGSDSEDTGKGLELDFKNFNFNAVYITDFPYCYQMQRCLVNLDYCPPHSMGKIR